MNDSREQAMKMCKSFLWTTRRNVKKWIFLPSPLSEAGKLFVIRAKADNNRAKSTKTRVTVWDTHLNETKINVRWGNARASRHHRLGRRYWASSRHQHHPSNHERKHDDKRLTRFHRHEDAVAARNGRRQCQRSESRRSTFHSSQFQRSAAPRNVLLSRA